MTNPQSLDFPVASGSRTGLLNRQRGYPLIAVALLAVFLTACSQQTETSTTPAPAEPAPATPPTKPRTPADPQVLAAQKALAELGYYRGQLDGISGPKTRRAVSDYQQDVGLTPDGTVTRDLVARLAEPSAPAAPRADHSGQGPLYETGDVYIYTDGSVETVVSADRQSVAWQNGRGSRWASPFDFTLATGQENGITVQQPLSWPLTVGAVSTYAVKSAAGAADPWQCAVEQREKISVAAGTFDTYKILCHPEGDASGAGQSRAWYYAPALRQYVRYVDSAAGPLNDVSGTRSRDLVAISPGAVGWPSEARTGFAWARSHTLESEADGARIPWESTAIADRFIIVPGPAVGSGNSPHCRRVTQERIESDGTTRLFPGVACRSADGQWQILGLDGNPVSIVAAAGP